MQIEATAGEYLYCFLLFNFIAILSFVNIKKRNNRLSSFIHVLVLIFCLTSYYDPDYYGYVRMVNGEAPIHEKIYEHIINATFHSNLLFRLVVWGGALFIYNKIIKLYKLSRFTSDYIFTIAFLLLFAYARASLAMVVYFLGIAYLTKQSRIKFLNIILGIALVFCAQFFHRSMLVLALMFPAIYLLKSRKLYVILLLCFPLALIGLSYGINMFTNGELAIGDDTFNSSATSYLGLENMFTIANDRFFILWVLKYIAIGILAVYTFIKINWGKIDVPRNIKQMGALIFCIVYFAMLFLIDGTYSELFSYRYLYMSLVPIVVVVTYMYDKKYLSFKQLNWLLLPSYIWANYWLIGKTFSSFFM